MLVHHDPEDAGKTILTKTSDYALVDGEPTVYLCHNQVCELPINGVDKLVERLSANYLFK